MVAVLVKCGEGVMNLRTWDIERELAASEELRQLSNWGRWGSSDERGAANLVDAEAVLRGIAAVRSGRVYGLDQPLNGNESARLTFTPASLHYMASDGGDARIAAGENGQNDRYPAFPDQQSAEDGLVFSIHGNTTHIDGLAHVWTDGVMFNGFTCDEVRSSGAQRLGIEKLGPLVTRGILLDVAGHRGVECLAADDLVTEGEVVACLQAAGLEVLPGDAVLVRTGWSAMYAQDPGAYSRQQPGLGASAGLYLARHDVALVGSDNVAVEAWCGHDEAALSDRRWKHSLLHVPLLRNLGIYLLEKLDLAALAADRVTAFLFAVAPLRIVGGTGSPVNPIAVV
jgi:kynurenine formamidase